MRKLFLVLLLFIISIIGLILFFNTITNSSKQVKIEPNTNLKPFDVSKLLSQALQIPTVQDSLLDSNFKAYNALIKDNFATLFDNVNVEWQRFEKHSLVGKWVGRNASLAPIILVASPLVSTPELETVSRWSYMPFGGTISDGFVHGAGAEGGKMAMVALLTAWQDLVQKKALPSRTVYFVFPHSPTGEKAILKALIAANKEPQFILKTGGGIAKNMLWDIPQPIAMIGVANSCVARVRLEIKGYNNKSILQQLNENIKQNLPTLDLENPVLQSFVEHLSPETTFGNKLLFSNQWLLKNIQQNNLENNPLVSGIFGSKIKTTFNFSSKSLLMTIDIHTSQPFDNIKEWVNSNIQHPQVHLLGEPKILQSKSNIAPIDNHSYRILSNTCKEVFAKSITAPCLVQDASSTAYYQAISPRIYYFNPVVYNAKTWENKQRGIDEKMSQKNLEKAVQFYHELLQNGVF